MDDKFMHNQYDLLKGCINRMFVTDNLLELQRMRGAAHRYIETIFDGGARRFDNKNAKESRINAETLLRTLKDYFDETKNALTDRELSETEIGVSFGKLFACCYIVDALFSGSVSVEFDRGLDEIMRERRKLDAKN